MRLGFSVRARQKETGGRKERGRRWWWWRALGARAGGCTVFLGGWVVRVRCWRGGFVGATWFRLLLFVTNRLQNGCKSTIAHRAHAHARHRRRAGGRSYGGRYSGLRCYVWVAGVSRRPVGAARHPGACPVTQWCLSYDIYRGSVNTLHALRGCVLNDSCAPWGH